jgi:VCBS repeat-containing protein
VREIPILVTPEGTFEYHPEGKLDWLREGDPFEDSFFYTITDDHGGYSTAEVHISVVGRNDPPKAVDDGVTRGYTTTGDRPLLVPSVDGVLTNDSDPDQGETDLLEVIPRQLGRTQYGVNYSINADGSFAYDPTDAIGEAGELLRNRLAKGEDVPDTFTYQVKDPAGELGEATVTVIVKADPSPYTFRVVAHQGEASTVRSSASGADFSLSVTFGELGRGPSINNLGNVAFAGETYDSLSGQWMENAYAYMNWDTGPILRRLMQDGFMLPNARPVDAPEGWLGAIQSFGNNVQINDANEVLAWRNLNAVVYLGTVFGFMPLLVTETIPLTYLETWHAEATRLPTQVAMADAGATAAGIKLGDPYYRDMQLATLTSFSPWAMALSGALMGPRMWFAKPVWGSLYPSPFNRAGDFTVLYDHP